MLKITNKVFISLAEVELTAIRAQGAGGQHVNKVSTAIHLRFNIEQSSLPLEFKERLRQLNDYRITAEGNIIIKAQQYRSQDKNKSDALHRLAEIIKKVSTVPTKRRNTKPTKGSVQRRLDGKKLRSRLKKMRQDSE